MAVVLWLEVAVVVAVIVVVARLIWTLQSAKTVQRRIVHRDTLTRLQLPSSSLRSLNKPRLICAFVLFNFSMFCKCLLTLLQLIQLASVVCIRQLLEFTSVVWSPYLKRGI